MVSVHPLRPPARRVTRAELAGLLAPAVGERVAHAAVRDAARKLGLTESEYAPDDAFRILDRLVETKGLMGITARFAKTRAILLWH